VLHKADHLRADNICAGVFQMGLCVYAGQKTSWKLNESRLHQHEKLMLRYIDNTAELELQCLYAIQSLINKLEHPQGKLHYRTVTSGAVSCDQEQDTWNTLWSSLCTIINKKYS
jgi:hypothetical protein